MVAARGCDLAAASASLVAAVIAVVAVSAPARADSPRDACIVASESGQELLHGGKLVDARARFVACATASCPGLVRDDCSRHLAEIEKALPSVVFEARDAAGALVTNVHVTIDDAAPFTERLDGATAIPVDPGEHRFTFDAAGFASVKKTVAFREGERGRHEIVALAAAEAQPTEGSSSPTAAYVAFGIGAVGLVVGGVAGGLGFSNASAAKSHCTGNVCTSDAQSGIDAAKRWAIVSDVGFVVGGLGVATGVVILLTRHRSTSASTARSRVVVGAGSLHWQGEW